MSELLFPHHVKKGGRWIEKRDKINDKLSRWCGREETADPAI